MDDYGELVFGVCILFVLYVVYVRKFDQMLLRLLRELYAGVRHRLVVVFHRRNFGPDLVEGSATVFVR